MKQIAIQVAKKVRAIRQERRWTQAQLAKLLGLSQNRLSEIEGGNGSFTAEQFITFLKAFNVSIEEFVDERADPDSEIQNALARLGAKHLRETHALPTQRIGGFLAVVKEAVVSASSRNLAALAPTIVEHAHAPFLNRLRLEFLELGLIHRWGWVLENTLLAIQEELGRKKGRLPVDLSIKYRKAEFLIARILSFPKFIPDPITRGVVDTLEATVTNEKTSRELEAISSKISAKWHIASRLQVNDFATALSSADDFEAKG